MNRNKLTTNCDDCEPGYGGLLNIKCIQCVETEREDLRKERDDARAKLERLAAAGTGYSQQTVDALTKDRDELRALLRRILELTKPYRAQPGSYASSLCDDIEAEFITPGADAK